MQAEFPEAMSPCPAKPIPLIRVAGLRPFVAFLARSGPPDGLLGRAGLPLRLLDHPETLISVAQAVGFMEDAAAARDLWHLGLQAGGETTIDALGLFGRAVGRSATLQEALDTLVRLAPAFDSGGRWWTAREGERVWLYHRLTPIPGTTCRQADGYWLAIALNLLRAGAGPDWQPEAIRMQTSEANGFRQAVAIPAARVSFSHSETAIAFPAALLGRPLPRRPAAPLDGREIERWKASGPANDFLGSVQQVIATLSSPAYPRIEVVARAIGTGVRTLQRRLSEAGASYERMLARARFDTAAHLLESTDATVLDIALDVGYSDHAHFTRAFRRWTGVPPREFRKHGRMNGVARMGRRP